MKIKMNLHFHTADDAADPIDYTTYQGIDHAAELGFGALALTCHQTFAWTPEYAEYAEKKGVLLIPGIEIYIGEDIPTSKRHALILNATKGAESVRTFNNLSTYKHEHPDAFVVAAHPFFYGNMSLKELLEPHIELFDAVEQSWFYSKWFDRNPKGRAMAKKYHLPFVSTSDTHFFDFMDMNYCTVEAAEKTPEAIFAALRAGNFENTTSPRRFWRDMVWKQGSFFLKEYSWRKSGGKLPQKVAKN